MLKKENNMEGTPSKYTCPITGGRLIHIGDKMDGLVHYYESEVNPAYRYRRYRLDWSVFELPGEDRYFHASPGEMQEVKKYGDKWLSVNATQDEIDRALADYHSRWMDGMRNMTMPTVRNVSAQTIADDILPVLPKIDADSDFNIIYGESDTKKTPTPSVRPAASPDDCPIVEYITGLLLVVSLDNIDDVMDLHPKAQVGDMLYEWDMGGWLSLSGRAGEALFRDDKLVSSVLTRMS
jgi:hypothetical protein